MDKACEALEDVSGDIRGAGDQWVGISSRLITLTGGQDWGRAHGKRRCAAHTAACDAHLCAGEPLVRGERRALQMPGTTGWRTLQ